MDAREQRGLVIAATQKLTQKGKVWLVPSQTGNGQRYTVSIDPETPFCSCPDHEATGGKCKHIHAVEFTLRRERQADGTVVETKTMTFTQKTTYPQNWSAYNLAQTTEKDRFQELLYDLCRGIAEPPQPWTGRRRTLLKDMVFASAFKVFSTFSSRRFGCDLKEAHAKGHLANLMNPMSVCAYLESESMTPVLTDLIEQSAVPLRAIETTFAPDSTGFSASRFVRWFDEKYGCERSGHDWVKAHAIVGVKTNVITSAIIAGREAGDSPQFEPLVRATAQNFKINDVCADKAYLSHANLELVASLGGTAYIPFKQNSTEGTTGGIWQKMFHFYNLRRDEFLRHYHQRSNVESTFSMVKAKFRDHVRSKTDVAMKNEVLCKLLCHNIVVVHQSAIELGIEPVFWERNPERAAVILPMKPANDGTIR